RLRVRSGRVDIEHGATVTTAEAGMEATVTTTGIAVRQVPVYGPEWTWATELAPRFSIEGRTVRALLEHVVGEEGWTLRYADPAVAETARRTILHGSVDGLVAKEALGAALATSGLKYHVREGELVVAAAAVTPEAR